MKRSMLACTAVLVLVVIAGCTTPQRSSAPPSSTPGAAGAAVAPGVYPKRGGRVEVVGTLVHRDLEGGFWAIVKSTPAPGAERAETLAVIANADRLPDLAGLSGSYVRATGTPLKGASIRMAGPEIAADTVTKAPVP